MKLFVGGLSWGTNDEALKSAFSKAGNVISAQVIIDRFSGKSKGFGFVEMSTDEEAQAAIKMFNEQELDGRKIIVNEARPKPEPGSGGNYGPRRDNRGGSFGGGGGFGGQRRDAGGYRRGGSRSDFRSSGHR